MMPRVPSLAEVACRARQEADKWLDRTLPPPTAAARPASAAAFFAGASDPRTPAMLRARAPEHVEAIAARAQHLASGSFDLLGYSDLTFGRPIDWHWDVVADRRSPLVHWSRINPLDAAAVGDHKVPWELSRHQWLVTLAQAWRLTGDERFASHALECFEDWEAANPYGMGLNWASSLEVAIRLMSWCWVLVLLDGSRPLTGERRSRLSRSIASHAAHVERYLSYYFSPNTHLTGEALGLLYAAAVVDCRRTARWRAVGTAILESEIERQVLDDGVYVEQATAYHRYTAEIYLQYLLLAAAGQRAPATVVTRVRRLLDALLVLRRPDGALLPIGDADGGSLLPLERRHPDDCRGIFSIAAALFERADYAWAAGGLAPETIWMLGADAILIADTILPKPPDRRPSVLLPDGGYVVMRTSWEEDAHQLVLDVGPLGCAASGAHGHADQLSIQVSPFGEAGIVDPGTGEYSDLRGWRTHFRRSAAHSTVRVDGLDHAEPAGPFSWRATRPSATLMTWRSSDAEDFAEARFSAFQTSTESVAHRRRVLSLGAHGWVVVDDVEGTGEHDVEVHWQFAPLDIRSDDGAIIATLGSGRALSLIPVARHRWYLRVARGSDDPIEGWCSPAYGIRVPAPHVVFSERLGLPARFATLLLPAPAPPARLPAVDATYDVQGALTAVAVPSLGIHVAVTAKDLQTCAA